MKPHVAVISTGGTLAMAPSDGPDAPLSVAFDARSLEASVPDLKAIARLSAVPLMQLDSGDLAPAQWVRIAEIVHEWVARDDVDGVVVVHGTDTMSYTASALAFLLGPLPKPVVLTGSQRPLIDVRTDARANLVDAVLAATLKIPEVIVAFASHLLRGCRTVKSDAWSFDAFSSPSCPPLVELGVGVDVAGHVRHAQALGALDLRIDPRVLAVRVFPGIDASLLARAIELGGVHGLVLEAYGTGNLPHAEGSSLIPTIERASRAGVPVVVVSQCLRGRVELSRYEGGAAAARAGAIDGGDMTVEAALAKLMVGLGRHRGLEAIRAFMLADVAGERTEHRIG
jgi:L-asparaginase